MTQPQQRRDPEITEAQALSLADEIFGCVSSLDELKRLAARANARYDAVRKAQKRQRKTGNTNDN